MKYFHGYSIVLAAFTNRFCGLGTFYSIGLYLTSIQRTFSTGIAFAALFPSIFGGISFGAVILSGPTQDWLTRHNIGIQPTFAVGGLFLGGGMVGASYARRFVVFLVCSVFAAIGMGFTAWASPGVVSLWFIKRKGVALSVALVGSGLGTFVYVLVTDQLLGKFQSVECRDAANVSESVYDGSYGDDSCDGWREAMRYSGAFSGIALILAAMPMRIPKEMEVENEESSEASQAHRVEDTGRNLEQDLENAHIEKLSESMTDQKGHNLEEEMKLDKNQGRVRSSPVPVHRRKRLVMMIDDGQNSEEDEMECDEGQEPSAFIMQQPDSVQDQKLDHWKPETEQPPNPPTRNLPPQQSLSRQLSFRETIQTRTYLCLVIWGFISSFAYDTVFILLPLSAEELSIPTETGSFALSLTGISLLLGNIVMGYASDSLGYVRTLQVTMFICMFAIFMWPYCTTGWSLCLFACVYSFFASAFPTKVSIIVESYGKASQGCIMTLFAAFDMACAPGTFLGPVVTGALVEHFSFKVGAFFLGGTFLIGNLALLLIPKHARQLDMIMTKLNHEM